MDSIDNVGSKFKLDFSSLDRTHLIDVCQQISQLISQLRSQRQTNTPDLINCRRITEVSTIQIVFLEKLLLTIMSLITDLDD